MRSIHSECFHFDEINILRNQTSKNANLTSKERCIRFKKTVFVYFDKIASDRTEVCKTVADKYTYF